VRAGDPGSLGSGSSALFYLASTSSFSDSELIQYLNPLGGGPSGKTCPKWASQTLHSTSILVIPKETSFRYLMTLSFSGCVKLGQPVRESNFIVESKSSVSQQIQVYFPGS